MVKSVSCPTADMTGIRGRRDGAGHILVVEGPQLFDGTASPPDDQHIRRVFGAGLPKRRKTVQCVDELGGRPFALYENGGEKEPPRMGTAVREC